jgi:putative hydrolase of the HAD superfamily
LKTIIFDFGNVVAFFDHRATLQRLLPYTHLTVEEMFHRVYDSPLEDEYEKGRIETGEALRQIHELWELRCDVGFLARSIADIFTPNPEVCALIPQLRPKYRLLLGSNTNDIHARQFRRQFADLLTHFDSLVLSFEIGHRKPSADFFSHCQHLAEAAPREIVFVDDLAANVEGARAHGWHAILYRPGDGLAEKLAALGIQNANSPAASKLPGC